MNNWLFRAPQKVRPGAAAAHLVITSAVLLLGACAAVQDSSHVEASSHPANPDVDFTSIQPELFSTAGSLSNAWADFDGDGDLDFAVSIKGGEVRLYRNDTGLFVNVGASMDLPSTGDEIRGLSWGDYDGDGDADLLGGSNVSPTPGRSYVFRNDGTHFVEVAQSIGLAIPGRFARQSNWIDYDNDGDLDLYAANRAGLNRMFNNNGGVFSAAGFYSTPTDPRRTVGACWFDVDRDGDLDLFLANQSGDSDALWRNDGKTFADIAPALGMDQTLRGLREGGVGCAVGDYDNDGDFDLYVVTYGPNLLYRNEGDGRFTEIGQTLGIAEPHSAVGAAWGDYDNDGDLDLSVMGYKRISGVQQPLHFLYRNDGGHFVNAIHEGHAMNAGDHAVAWIDYDNDGDLDLSVTDGYGADGGHFVFRNNLPATDRQRSLRVMVLDGQGRFLEPGAEVRLHDQAGNVLGSRLVDTGGGYNAQNAAPVHFGLPSSQPVRVEVVFMGGAAGRLVQSVPDVVPDGRTLEVRRDAAR